MGKLMGAKKQIFQENLKHNGQANRGQLIVRTQAIQQSNLCAKIALKWQNIHDVAGSMCCESQVPYYCEIQREIPGTQNFATIHRYPIQYRGKQQLIQEQDFPISTLCNGDKNLRLKIRLVSDQNVELNGAICSINDLEQGQTTQ